jgi:aspartate racemase
MPFIGVLGGMGPAATVDFLDKIVQLTPAKCDQEHLPWIVSGIPQIFDRSQAILGDGPNPFSQLASGVDFLNRAGAGVIVIPCNSSHHWYDQLLTRSRAPILHIAETAVYAISPCSHQRVAILATRGTMSSGFYQQALAKRQLVHASISTILQDRVDRCISLVKAAEIDEAADILSNVAQMSVAQGVTNIILACTELSVAASFHGVLPAVFVNSSLELAAAAVRYGLERKWNHLGNLTRDILP